MITVTKSLAVKAVSYTNRSILYSISCRASNRSRASCTLCEVKSLARPLIPDSLTDNPTAISQGGFWHTHYQVYFCACKDGPITKTVDDGAQQARSSPYIQRHIGKTAKKPTEIEIFCNLQERGEGIPILPYSAKKNDESYSAVLLALSIIDPSRQPAGLNQRRLFL